MLPDDNRRRRARSLVHQLDCTARCYPPSLDPFASTTSSQYATLVVFDPTTPRTTGGSPPAGKPTSASIVPSARRPLPYQAPLAPLGVKKCFCLLPSRTSPPSSPREEFSPRRREKLVSRHPPLIRPARATPRLGCANDASDARGAWFVIRRRRHVRRAPPPPPPSPHPQSRNARPSHHAFRVVCAYDPGAGIIPGVRMYP